MKFFLLLITKQDIPRNVEQPLTSIVVPKHTVEVNGRFFVFSFLLFDWTKKYLKTGLEQVNVKEMITDVSF